jgi:copper chaperone CopZ
MIKNLFALATIVAALSCSALAAETSVKLSDVHLCCNSCVKGVDKAVSGVSGVKAESDKDAGTVTITAPDQATAQKAVNALVAAGYFGKSSDSAIKVRARNGAKAAKVDGKVQTLKVSGVHLCCNKCVTSVNDALSKVNGVKANTAAKGAETFEVTGDFEGQEVFKALNKAGLAGKAVAN